MKSRVIGALLGAGTALAISAAAALPAAAATSGSETVNGILVTSGMSGTRTDISSVAVARGVFDGVGQIVEIPARPGDPANVSRDDLVYPEGTMHLVNTTVGFSPCSARRSRRTRGSPAASGCSPMRAAPLPARSAPRGCCPATPTAAARSGSHRCTRWIRSRSAERCHSDLDQPLLPRVE